MSVVFTEPNTVSTQNMCIESLDALSFLWAAMHFPFLSLPL